MLKKHYHWRSITRKHYELREKYVICGRKKVSWVDLSCLFHPGKKIHNHKEMKNGDFSGYFLLMYVDPQNLYMHLGGHKAMSIILADQ
jgi:hypothetical protein